jgi:hypothetical protein
MAYPTSNLLEIVFDAGLDSYLGLLPRVTQNEIYGRYNAIYYNGVKDPVSGREFLMKSLKYNDFIQTVESVGKDLEIAHKIIHLMTVQKTPAQAVSMYRAFSDYAQLQIVECAGKNSLSEEELLSTILTLFAKMAPFDYVHKPVLI